MCRCIGGGGQEYWCIGGREWCMDVCSALVVVMSVQVVGLGCCAGFWVCRRGRVV